MQFAIVTERATINPSKSMEVTQFVIMYLRKDL